MEVGSVIFWIILAVVILFEVILYGVTRLVKTDGRVKDDYDERQEIVRGKGYRAGFFAMMLPMAAYGLCAEEFDFPVNTAVMVFLIVFFGVLVYAVYCIWGHAYFPINGKKTWILVLLVPVSILDILLGIQSIQSGEAFTNGKLNFQSLPFFAGILFAVVLLAAVLRMAADRREERLER